MRSIVNSGGSGGASFCGKGEVNESTYVRTHFVCVCVSRPIFECLRLQLRKDGEEAPERAGLPPTVWYDMTGHMHESLIMTENKQFFTMIAPFLS